jgi:hypothetical protein
VTRIATALRRRGGALALLGAVLLAVVPASPARSQDTSGGFDFENLHALADGITVAFNLQGFLPIEDLVGLSSITSESHFGAGRSDSLAALPDPGDLVLSLPGTLSALTGISGLPDYPAAASADNPSTPVDDVQLVPDAGLGVGHLHAEASDTASSAFAHVGYQVDTIGLLPSFSIASVRTTAHTEQLNPDNLEAVATTTISGVKLLGGLITIDEMTSEVSATVTNGHPRATVSKVVVSGASIAGTPVGITDKGIVGLGSPTALAPVIDKLVAPLVGQGIKIHTTPATTTETDTTATASGGGLTIEVPLKVEGYPGILDVTLGRALAELEVGGRSSDEAVSSPSGTDTSVPDLSGPSLPGLGDVGTGDLGLGLTTPARPSTRTGAGPEVVSVPATRAAVDLDLTTLYRVLLLGGLALFAAGQLIVRSTIRPSRRPDDLRQLWRW